MTDDTSTDLAVPRRLAVLPLRDVVVYPHMVVPLFVGRKPSILALENAMAVGKEILLVAQRKPEVDEPQARDIYRVGTLATVLQMMKMPDNTVKVMVQGVLRARLNSLKSGKFFSAEFETVSEEAAGKDKPEEMEALRRSLLSQFESYVKLHKNVPPEALAGVSGLDDTGRLADTIAAHMQLALEKKQVVLETGDPGKRMEYLVGLMGSEIDMLKIERKIRGRVKTQMEKSQREYYLNEQMKAIQKELGELDEAPDEITSLEKGIKEAGMTKEAQEKAMTELGKLKMMAPMSAEATVVRNYLDWLLKAPWKKQRRTNGDLARAAKVLEEDHYGLEKVKERILEYLAVQKRVRSLKGPILCLVGPPGVGKTSLGRSIARATNRSFVRMSLGGVRDEAEIRGHRRTYIGALPGKIIQNLARSGVRNPLFLFDEVDKMSMDFRGDPSSALLEVLDPEQNSTFNDHYLEVDFDLSRVMFVCTANTLAIPPPLLDRMEVLRIPGYTEDEKLAIARNYLIAKQMKNNGVRKDELRFTAGGLRNIIRHYTREAGVRNLEREIARVCRKVVKRQLLRPSPREICIGPRQLEPYLGVRKFRYGRAENQNRVGQTQGLAWTEVGGELLRIEASVSPGKGKLTLTGKLGDVMQESIQAALTVVRTRAASLGLDPGFQSDLDLHVHVPEGATPKDGPSAGIGMCTALVSALTGIPVRADVAMTGEITLGGEVLPVGGLKEKLLAAHRGGIERVLIPEECVKDLAEIPANVKRSLDIRSVRWIDEVLEHALENMPGVAAPVADDQAAAATSTPAAPPSPPDQPRTH
ncbi:MAG: endopeptidase La [Gammaproteobacteria bacterium]|nr:endopeptidase La [Gammaproteobacteria bacterium]MYD01784.1 endopeptidase La [Gammaproteobacteria bacterium]MYI25226.1 endopeptidase La [Gammaproteobacteria bacterium]